MDRRSPFETVISPDFVPQNLKNKMFCCIEMKKHLFVRSSQIQRV